MRTLIYSAFVSLDGVVDSPGGGSPTEAHRSAGWTFKDIDSLPEAYELKGREQDEAGALMLGRRSYQAFSPVWPSMTDQFARYNELPKYIVSTTMTEDALVDARAHDEQLARAQRDEPAHFEDFARRIAGLQARLDVLTPRVATLGTEQQGALQEIAITSLASQKERLAQYTAQARYAVAQLYDRATEPKEGDHAAKP